MDRRRLFKTGLTLAGSSLFTSLADARTVSQDNGNDNLSNRNSRDGSLKTSPRRRKVMRLVNDVQNGIGYGKEVITENRSH